ncbi:MAG: hypothetical protein AAB682_00090 [Patescibacteria group bacterium]
MNRTASVIIIGAIVIAMSIIYSGDSMSEIGGNVQNVEIRDGIQFITINAKGGYSPRISFAKAGIPTKLIVKTNSTYDCSAALVVRSVGFQKILKNTAEEIIDIGIPKAGEPLRGVCGMGMYGFQVKFD